MVARVMRRTVCGCRSISSNYLVTTTDAPLRWAAAVVNRVPEHGGVLYIVVCLEFPPQRAQTKGGIAVLCVQVLKQATPVSRRHVWLKARVESERCTAQLFYVDQPPTHH